MGLEEFNRKLERGNFYQFMQRHKRVINIVQGMIIIGLLIGINSYVVKDHFIKKQIKENCGYTTSKYECICEKNYVENWKELERGIMPDINLSGFEDVDR